MIFDMRPAQQARLPPGFSEGRSGLGNAFPRLLAAEAEGHFSFVSTAVKAVFI